MSVLPPIEMVSIGASSRDRSIASVVAAVLAPGSATGTDATTATTAPTKATLDFEPRLRLTGFEPELDPHARTGVGGEQEKMADLVTTLNQVHVATAAFSAVIGIVQQIPDSFKRLMQG